MIRALLRRATWLLRPPTKVDLEQAVVDDDLETVRALVRSHPSLAREAVQGTAWGPLLFAAVHDDLALLHACRDADRLVHGSALELRSLGVLCDHPLHAHPQVVAVPLTYLGLAKLLGAGRVYLELAREATLAERALCLPLAVAIHDDRWFAELVASGARADAIESPGYHLVMLDPTPAQLALILATGGEEDPTVSTSPPGFEEGDFPVLRLSEARRTGADYWMSTFRPRRR